MIRTLTIKTNAIFSLSYPMTDAFLFSLVKNNRLIHSLPEQPHPPPQPADGSKMRCFYPI
jgi:hypothetical protein